MKEIVEVIERVVIYENPVPNLVSRHAYFPCLSETMSGDIIALFTIGDAFESMYSNVYLSRSKDRGKTWILECPIFKSSKFKNIGPCIMKPSLLKNGALIAIGYGFYRENPEIFINQKTGGLPEGMNLITFSFDNGRTWQEPEILKFNRPELLEIVSPCFTLENGELITTGTTFPMWNGKRPSGKIGILLRSKDNGQSWDDKTIFYSSSNITPYETHPCIMEDGRILIILWLLNEKSGKSLTNHIVVSYDNGITWSEPIDTKILGQSSNLLPLNNNFILCVHCYREKNVGLYVNVVEFKDNKWKVVYEKKIWGMLPSGKITSLKDMGKYCKFGQPSIFPLSKKEFLVVLWAVEDCVGKIISYRIKVDLDYLKSK